MKSAKPVLIVVIVLLIIGGILGAIQYHSWRQSFVEPVRMHDAEKGVFESHPDNAMPDKKANFPEGVL